MRRTDMKNFFGVNIEVMMADDIPQPLGFLPIDLRVLWKQSPSCDLVQVFQDLSNDDQQHADTVELFRASGSSGEIFHRFYRIESP
jgi:hypothetical protein